MSEVYSEKNKNLQEINTNTTRSSEIQRNYSINEYEYDNDYLNTAHIWEEGGETENKLPVISGKQINKPPLPEEILPEPEYIGIDEKFAQIKSDDGERMIKVRTALKHYHEALSNNSDVTEPLNAIIKACDNYTYMRFSLFRGSRGKKRLKEVKELRDQARTLQLKEESRRIMGDDENISQQNLWRYSGKDYDLLANDIRRNIRNENKEKDVDREALRKKKTYKVKKLDESQQDNNTRHILGSQKIRSIKDAISEVMPEAYRGVDKSLTDKEAEEKEMELIHSEGSKFLDMGHDVIEFDVAGSSFDQFRKEHEGIHGMNAFDNGQTGLIFDEKMDKDGYIWRSEKSQLSGEGESERLAKKTKYSIAGPWNLNLNHISNWSIQATRKRIRDMGVSHLKPVFDKWKALEEAGGTPKYYNIDLMFKGHSRGGVGASHGAMMLKHWLQENYPQYVRFISFNLIQYDPVPGADVELSAVDDMERYDVKEYQGVNKGSFEIDGEKMAPLGTEAGTTVLYSMVNQDDWFHRNLFAPQEVLHAKRLILMPFTHDIGMDLAHIDTSQMKGDENEKAHSMAFINATDNKVYRSSGLNELDEGVYVMDEHHVMVKVDTFAQLKNILMRTMPDTYEKRRERILRAAASIFGDRQMIDEYASIDHERNQQLSKAIEEDGSPSEYRKAVQDDLRNLRTLLKNKPEKGAFSSIDNAYEKAINSCSYYIEKRDDGKWTKRGRRRLEEIKDMYSALIRERRHFQQKLSELDDLNPYGSWDEIFHRTVSISRSESDLKKINDKTMDNAYRVEHGKSVAFFAEMEESKASSASAISHMMERSGFQGLYRAATEAKVTADEENREMKGIVYEQTYDLSYDEAMSSDFEYSRNKKVEMEEGAQKKLREILAFDLLFGIRERLSGNLSSLRVSLQRHQDENTLEIARSGNLSDLKDTYTINDVCADIIVSPLFTGGLTESIEDFELKAIKGLHKDSVNILKNLSAEKLKDMAGTSLTEDQLTILTGRLNAIRARL